jgi:hypothetical protein
MDLHEEWRQLRRDAQRLYLIWRHRPLTAGGLWLCAFGRIWILHDENNHVRTLIFLGLSAVVATLVAGIGAGGWDVPPAVVLPIMAGWLFTLGLMLGYEVEYVNLRGVEVDLNRGEVRPSDGGGARDE